ncbi:MAG: hypothetical protein JXR51_13225, partial [Bacteroidales bacterium]|nr:hypothetical protein [Bacteroidales bacterium]
EAAQTLTFHLTNNNNGLFSVQPSVSATGILTYTPTANANGSATVTIWLTDDGGTANGGDDTSPTYSFTITVNAINDIPTLVINTGKIVLEAAGSQVISNSELQYIDVDHISSEIVYTLTSSTSNGTLYNGVSALSATNTFTQQDIDNGDINYTHNGGETTTDNFQFTVADILGGTVLGVQTFNLTITPVNDSPVFVSTPSNFGAEGVLYTYNITTTDSDLPANALTITAPIKPIWLTLSDNGDGTAALFGTPPDGAARSNSIIINVNDASVNIQQSYTLVLSYDISVPGNYPTIQQAIDASVDGDIISVSNGLYPENINFNGKEVELIGNSANPALVIIDGGLGSGAAVTFENGESASTSINGFTIQNGTGHSGVAAPFSRNAPSSGYYGGGIFIYQSSPLLKNIIVENNTLPVNNNHGGSGGGIYIGNNSNVTIEGPNTIIRNNNATIYRGGGICIDNSTVNIDGILAGGVLIENNNGGNYGGGISSFESTLNLTNVTIISNIVDGANGTGGGVYSLGSTLNQNMGTIINANSATVGSNDIQTF